MQRNVCYTALILRCRPLGESNRDIWLLTAEEGILRAIVFGGPKSKLRSYASPFHSGQAWIYHEPVKDSRKLGDFDVQSWRPGLRELYERAMAADAVAETILASHGGGGNWIEALTLAEAVLDAISDAGSSQCSLLLWYFLWQWAGILGIRPCLDDLPELSPGCRRWLNAISTLSPGQVVRFTLDTKTGDEVFMLITSLLAEVIGRRLASWQW